MGGGPNVKLCVFSCVRIDLSAPMTTPVFLPPKRGLAVALSHLEDHEKKYKRVADKEEADECTSIYFDQLFKYYIL